MGFGALSVQGCRWVGGGVVWELRASLPLIGFGFEFRGRGRVTRLLEIRIGLTVPM